MSTLRTTARSVLAIVAVGGVLGGGLLALGGSASAAPSDCPPGGGAGWSLASVTIALPAIDNGDFSDANGNGLACFRVNAGQSKKNGTPSFTWKDDHVVPVAVQLPS